jgi:hypothetical protein
MRGSAQKDLPGDPVSDRAGNQRAASVHRAWYTLSDTLRRFADKSSVPPPSRGRFFEDIDTVLCMYPVVPEGSNIEVPRFVTLREYTDLLASLTERGPRVPWMREQWYAFIRDRRLFRLEERPGLERQARAEGYLIADYCRQFVTGHELGLSARVPTAGLYFREAA